MHSRFGKRAVGRVASRLNTAWTVWLWLQILRNDVDDVGLSDRQVAELTGDDFNTIIDKDLIIRDNTDCLCHAVQIDAYPPHTLA